MRSTEEKNQKKSYQCGYYCSNSVNDGRVWKSQSRKEPITLTIWHVYGGQTDSPLNDLIDEFNGTEGKKKKV